MAEAETVDATAPVVEFDDSEIRAGLVELAEKIDKLNVQEHAPEFTPLEVFGAAIAMRNGVKVQNHALADVIGDLGSADASGIVPDSYWAGGLQHYTDRRRPLYATAGAAPFPASGNNLELPRVTQATAVGLGRVRRPKRRRRRCRLRSTRSRLSGSPVRSMCRWRSSHRATRVCFR